MTQEALKLAEIIERFDSNDESLPLELLKEISATLRALAQTQEPVAQPASEEDMKIYKTIAANYHKDLSTPPQRTEQELVGTVKELFTNSAWDRLNVRGSTKVYLEKDNT